MAAHPPRRRALDPLETPGRLCHPIDAASRACLRTRSAPCSAIFNLSPPNIQVFQFVGTLASPDRLLGPPVFLLAGQGRRGFVSLSSRLLSTAIMRLPSKLAPAGAASAAKQDTDTTEDPMPPSCMCRLPSPSMWELPDGRQAVGYRCSLPVPRCLSDESTRPRTRPASCVHMALAPKPYTRTTAEASARRAD